MNILIFGATGMVGQGVLRECLLDSGVRLVQTVGRVATDVQHPKLRDIVHKDFGNYSPLPWNCPASMRASSASESRRRE